MCEMFACADEKSRSELGMAQRRFGAGEVTVMAPSGGSPRDGAPRALMVRRINDAAAAGGDWVTCETGAETPENPNPSLHNMRRMGIPELYERRNWIWRA